MKKKVKLYHGPWVSKSTARRIGKQNEAWNPLVFGFFIFMCIAALLLLVK
jgi:hypothetical protein